MADAAQGPAWAFGEPVTDVDLLDLVRMEARSLVGYEPDRDMTNAETALLVQEMSRMAKTWRRARDTMRRLDDGGE